MAFFAQPNQEQLNALARSGLWSAPGVQFAPGYPEFVQVGQQSFMPAGAPPMPNPNAALTEESMWGKLDTKRQVAQSLRDSQGLTQERTHTRNAENQNLRSSQTWGGVAQFSQDGLGTHPTEQNTRFPYNSWGAGWGDGQRNGHGGYWGYNWPGYQVQETAPLQASFVPQQAPPAPVFVQAPPQVFLRPNQVQVETAPVETETVETTAEPTPTETITVPVPTAQPTFVQQQVGFPGWAGNGVYASNVYGGFPGYGTTSGFWGNGFQGVYPGNFGYGRTSFVQAPAQVQTVPVGYGNGFVNNGWGGYPANYGLGQSRVMTYY